MGLIWVGDNDHDPENSGWVDEVTGRKPKKRIIREDRRTDKDKQHAFWQDVHEQEGGG